MPRSLHINNDTTSDDTESLSALRSGSPEALARCFREHAPSLRACAARGAVARIRGR